MILRYKAANNRAQGTDFNPLKSYGIVQRNWNRITLFNVLI
jgi:hypothetical protein